MSTTVNKKDLAAKLVAEFGLTKKDAEGCINTVFEEIANTLKADGVVDIYGNVVPVQINVTQVDDKSPEINIEYQYSEDNLLCTIVVTSNEEMKAKTTPGWVLSEDKKVYRYSARKYDGGLSYLFVGQWFNK